MSTRDSILNHIYSSPQCKTCLLDQWAGQLESLAEEGLPTPMMVVGGVPMSLICWTDVDHTSQLTESARDA